MVIRFSSCTSCCHKFTVASSLFVAHSCLWLIGVCGSEIPASSRMEIAFMCFDSVLKKSYQAIS
eukprot:jgi/Botrbrau1/12806/Bobra.117_1s0022.1